MRFEKTIIIIIALILVNMQSSFVGGFSLGLSVTGPTLSLTPGLTTTILHSSIKTCTIGSLICR